MHLAQQMDGVRLGAKRLMGVLSEPSLYQKSQSHNDPSVASSQPTFSTLEFHSPKLQSYEIDRELLCRLDDLVRGLEAVERVIYKADGHQCT